MASFVRNYVLRCAMCQQAKINTHPTVPPLIYREQKGLPWGSGTPLGACQTMKTSGYARGLAYPLVFGLTRELFKVSVRP